MLLEATARQTTKNRKIKPQEDTRFNVENPSNAKGKTTGASQQELHYIGCVLQRLAAAYKRNNELWSKP